MLYQDEVHGPLVEQVDKTVDLVYTKYMKTRIDYEGVQRIEQFMFHKDAFREILLNAIVHKDYSSCNPIQISVYEDKIYIWNDGQHPNQNGQDLNKMIIDFCIEPGSVQEIMDKFGIDSRTSFRRKYLTPMLEKGVLKMTIPEKPSSKNQKYFS